MPTIIYFETASDGIERSKKFYNELFGSPNKWLGQLQEGLGDQHYYWVVTAIDDKGSKTLGGSGLKGYCGIAMLRGISVYVDVLQGAAITMDQYIAKVEQLGGKVIFPKKELLGMGYYAICADTENNGFAIWQTDITVRGGPTSLLQAICG